MPLRDRSTIDSIWASSYAASMELDELPPHIRLRVNTLGISQPTAWIHQPVPALGDSSIAEVLQREGGEAIVTDNPGRNTGVPRLGADYGSRRDVR